MSERYTKLFYAPENRYTVGAPILIAAGALLKDNQTDKLLAQIKFKSISEKKIKAVKISVSAYDIAGKELEGVAEYQYLDLSVARNEEFGQKQAVTLPNVLARSFEAKCTDVYFADGSLWHTEADASWRPLPERVTVSEGLGHLAAQYQRDTSIKSKFVPVEHEALWLCSCGALNLEEEGQCHKCLHSKDLLFAALDLDGLQQRNDAYKDAEAREATAQVEIAKVKKAKIKKMAFVMAKVAVAVVVVIAAFALINKVIVPKIEQGQYKQDMAKIETEYDNAYALLMNNSAECSEQDRMDALSVVLSVCLANRNEYADTSGAMSSSRMKKLVSFEQPIIDLGEQHFANKRIEDAYKTYREGVILQKEAAEQYAAMNPQASTNWTNGGNLRYEAIIALCSEGIVKTSEKYIKIYCESYFATKIMLKLAGNVTFAAHSDGSYGIGASVVNDTKYEFTNFKVTANFGAASATNEIEVWKPGETWDLYFTIPQSALSSSISLDVDCTFEGATLNP